MKTAYFMPKKSDLLFECKMNSSFGYLWPKTISNVEHKPIKSASIGQKEHLYTHLPKWSESFEWLGIGLLPASSPTMLRAASEAGKWPKIKPSSRYRTWFINKADCNYELYTIWHGTIPYLNIQILITYHLSLIFFFFKACKLFFHYLDWDEWRVLNWILKGHGRVSLAVWLPLKPTLAAEETKVDTWQGNWGNCLAPAPKWPKSSNLIKDKLTNTE